MAEDRAGPGVEPEAGTAREPVPPETDRDDPSIVAELLADPATWIDPPEALEGGVVSAVAAHVSAEAGALRAPARRRRRFALMVSATAAAVVLVVAAVALKDGSRPIDFHARLQGTALAPSARASAGIVKGRGGFTVTLHAQGLTALPPREFYQAWLRNASGTLVPIGTFSSSDAQITLWSGVSPHDFPTITVTIERSDGDQTSSGRKVLVGTARAG